MDKKIIKKIQFNLNCGTELKLLKNCITIMFQNNLYKRKLLNVTCFLRKKNDLNFLFTVVFFYTVSLNNSCNYILLRAFSHTPIKLYTALNIPIEARLVCVWQPLQHFWCSSAQHPYLFIRSKNTLQVTKLPLPL
jgi:hypothetical protein